MSISERRQVWSQRLQDFRNSGQTQSAWCKTQGLSIHQLRYWLKRKQSVPEQSAPANLQWIEVSVEAAPVQEEQETLRT